MLLKNNVLSIIFAIFITMSFVMISFVYAVTGSSTNFGSLNINQDQISILEDELSIIQVTGTVEDYMRGVAIHLEISKPDGSSEESTTQASSDGSFSTSILLDTNWMEGNYEINGIYQGNNIGTVTFTIIQTAKLEFPSFSSIGTIEIEEEEFTISKGSLTVDVEGNVKNYEKGNPITLEVSKPDGTSELFTISGNKKTGDYVAHLTISDEWPSGNYQIIGKYNDEYIGSVEFVLNKLGIPDWIKNNADWWAKNQIEDSDFVNGIQYLIKEKIITIPVTNEIQGNKSKEIPSWIKNNADWWAQGLISDDDFVKGIEYLVKNGMILV